MLRSITCLLLLGMLLSTHAFVAVCGLRCDSQLQSDQPKSAGMHGMAHCHTVSQTANPHSMQRECRHSGCNQEELALVANRQIGGTRVGTKVSWFLRLTDVQSASRLVARTAGEHRRLRRETSSSPESILNIRV
jgi:hypothetical protein